MSYAPAVSTGVTSAIPKWTLDSSIDLTSAATSTIVNVTESGILEQVSFQLISAGITGTPTAYFRITSDGTAGDDIYIYQGSAGWVSSTKMFIFSGDGATQWDRVTILLGIPYRTSLKVDFTVSSAATTGEGAAGVLRAKSN